MSKRYVAAVPNGSSPLPPRLADSAHIASGLAGNSHSEASEAKLMFVTSCLAIIPPSGLDALVSVCLRYIAEKDSNKETGLGRPQWADRPAEARSRGLTHENAVEFCRRVYSDLIADGRLTNETLYMLDPPLLKAVRQWVQRHPRDGIAGLTPRLPTLAERVARLSPQTDLDEIIRLGYALNKEKIRRRKAS